MSGVAKTLLYACAAICLAGVWPANQIAADYITDGNSQSSVTINNQVNAGGGNATSQTTVTTSVNGQTTTYSTSTSGSDINVDTVVNATASSGGSQTIITNLPKVPFPTPTGGEIAPLSIIVKSPKIQTPASSSSTPAFSINASKVRITRNTHPVKDVYGLFFGNKLNLKGFWWF